jgi:2-desacetyl-2-hydroxyethyl bacteriochlorophyllide A dehydrogenase
MSTAVRTIIFPRVNEIALGEFELPAVPPGHVLTRTLYTLVSPGTELRVLGGKYGATGNFPLIPGSCAVGEILELGADVSGLRVGDRVSYCPDPNPAISPRGIHGHWGGHASHHIVPVDSHPIILPPAADPLDYAIAEIAAISWRGVAAAQPQAGETAIVIGQGTIGAFSAMWLASLGGKVIAADLADHRLERALAYGAAETVNVGATDAVERLLAHTDGGADIVVETSGVNAGVALGHRVLRRAPLQFRQSIQDGIARWPRLVYQANYLAEFPIDPHGYFPGEGVLVLTPADRGRDDRLTAVDMIRQRRIDPRAFIERIAAPSEAPDCYATLRDHPDKLCSVVFDWSRE